MGRSLVGGKMGGGAQIKTYIFSWSGVHDGNGLRVALPIPDDMRDCNAFLYIEETANGVKSTYADFSITFSEANMAYQIYGSGAHGIYERTGRILAVKLEPPMQKITMSYKVDKSGFNLHARFDYI